MTQLYILGKTSHIYIILAKLDITGPENLQILCTYRESQPETEKSNPPHIFQMVIDYGGFFAPLDSQHLKMGGEVTSESKKENRNWVQMPM